MKLRYHHLLCIPRYEGKGYSEEFCENLQIIKEQIKTKTPELVLTCDDVCKSCPNNINGICKDEEKVHRYDLLVKNAIESGESLSPKNICTDCRWYYICKNKLLS